MSHAAATALVEGLAARSRVRLATLPTPLEPGGALPGGATLLVKRDDLTGLGMGGNKARKLEFLCGDAVAQGADTLVTVGAAQSNHARMTAAAGAVLGMDVHLVLGGAPGQAAEGNQLLARMFGARLHHPGSDDWAQLATAAAGLVAELESDGRRPYAIPIGGSTPVGAAGFAAAWVELMAQCEAAGVRPAAVVHASSTGGTHAGLLAGAAAWRASARPAPRVLAVDVAKESADLADETARLARETLELLGVDGAEVTPDLVHLDGGWIGSGYALPTPEGDAAGGWAARHGAWILDRTYTGKAFAALLGADEQGRLDGGETVVFWHTGGQPAVFATGGAVLPDHVSTSKEYA